MTILDACNNWEKIGRLKQKEQDKKLFNDFIEKLKEETEKLVYSGSDIFLPQVELIKEMIDNLKKEYFGETKGEEMNKEKFILDEDSITDEEYLEQEFPKGKTKFRGQAMVLLALARQQGKQEMREECIKEIRKLDDYGMEVVRVFKKELIRKLTRQIKGEKNEQTTNNQ